MAPIPVPAPPLLPPRYSLLAVAQQVGDDWPVGWQDQITWEPECAQPTFPVRPDCGPLERDAAYPDGTSNPERPIVSAVMLQAEDSCSTMGSRGRDWQGRARRKLAATESFQLASQLWFGVGTSDDTPFLLDGDAVDVTAPAGSDLIGQVAALEQTAGMFGLTRIWLHMSPSMFTRLAAAFGGALQMRGDIAVTPLGSTIVADRGYLGFDPTGSGENEIIVATAPVQVHLGPVEILGGDDNSPDGYALSRNDRTVIAQRLATYQLDPCARAQIITDVPVVPF